MPSTSKKQHNFMEAIAHSASFAKKVGVPQSVGKDFSTADKGKTFKRGGTMATKMDPKMMAMMAAKKRGAGMGAGMGAGRGAMAPARPAMAPARPAMPPAGGMGMMNKGGTAAFEKSGKDVEKKGMKEGSKADMALDKKQMMMKKGGAAKKMNMGGMGYAKGGGIESKGKTKGKMIVMKSGGGTKKYC
jgi:hypothetical protein